MAKKTKQPKTAPAKKQTEIPGTERKRVAGIENAADAVRAVSVEMNELKQLKTEHMGKLIDEMRKHDVRLYKFDDDGVELVVELVDTTKAKIRKANVARSEDE